MGLWLACVWYRKYIGHLYVCVYREATYMCVYREATYICVCIERVAARCPYTLWPIKAASWCSADRRRSDGARMGSPML